MTPIYDLNNCPYSMKHGSYGGQAGFKDGILINGVEWIVKYPKSTAGLKGDIDISKTTSPLSEYIGSHVYQILGIDVHDTILGYRNGQICVACRDFCGPGEVLTEFRTIKNAANKDLQAILDRDFSSSSDHETILDETLLHIQYNDVIKNISGVSERFWDSVIIDTWIGNNDRNNGNWGFVRNLNDYQYHLAPVYDNGNSFAAKTSDQKISSVLDNHDKLVNRVLSKPSSYMLGEKKLSSKDILRLDNEDLNASLVRIVPIMILCQDGIANMIDDIPETYEGQYVCSQVRKTFYKEYLSIRLEKVLLAAVQEKGLMKEVNDRVDELILSYQKEMEENELYDDLEL